MTELGNSLYLADHFEDALSVLQTRLSTMRRLGDSERNLLCTLCNLANTYASLGQRDEAIRIEQEVYSGHSRLYGEQHERTLLAANNYANSLVALDRFEEAKALFRKSIPVARRVVGDSNDLTLRMRSVYALSLCMGDGATLDDLREAVTTLEDAERIARRVLGAAHPLTTGIEEQLQNVRAALRAHETPSPAGSATAGIGGH